MCSTEERASAGRSNRCKSPLINSLQLAGLGLFLLTFCDCSLLCQIFHCRSAETKRATDNWEQCASQIQPRMELQGKAREVAYQADIARACTMRGADDCKLALAARHSVDSFAAASQLIAGTFTPAQYLAVSRDRARKRWAAETTPQLAARLCRGTDADGDFVPDDIDKCTNTPDLTATDDKGCTDSTLPKSPSAEDVHKLLDKLRVPISPNCNGAPRPPRIQWSGNQIAVAAVSAPSLSLPHPPVDWFGFPRATNQPARCPIWYQMEVEEDKSACVSPQNYSVVFRQEEARDSTAEYLTFAVRSNDPGFRGRIASFLRCRARGRVRAINGNGIRGPWSEWF